MSDFFIQTKNKMGYMTREPDLFSLQAISIAKQLDKPFLEIGAAYGVATLIALQQGLRVIANDLDKNHLAELYQRVPVGQRDQLTLLPGSFPDEIDLPEKSVGTILSCRVFHFFDGDTIRRAMQKIYSVLDWNGQAIIIAETPYLKFYKDFIPIYEKRVSEGAEWPGLVEVKIYSPPERAANLPPFMNFLDPEVLTREARLAQLEVVHCKTFSRDNFPDDIRLDGRESVVLIAKKVK